MHRQNLGFEINPLIILQMQKVNKHLTSSTSYRFLAMILFFVLYSSNIFTGLSANQSISESTNYSYLFESNLLTSKSLSSNFFGSETLSEFVPENSQDKIFAFEVNENEEEIDVFEEDELSNRNNLRKFKSNSNLLYIYSLNLQKRKVIPLYILFSSWKTYNNN